MQINISTSMFACISSMPNWAAFLSILLLVLSTSVTAQSVKYDTGILKAPFPALDDHTCNVKVNNRPIQCDLALYMQGGSRRRVQFNNDDSGRMVIFEGKISANDTVIVDYITVGTVKGQPKKVRSIKANGLCIPHGGRTAECHAQTVDGKLFEASVEGPKTESAQNDSLQNEIQCVPKTGAARILQSPNPNDIDPHWKGEATVGTSSVFILKTEWDCASAEEWQKRGQSEK